MCDVVDDVPFGDGSVYIFLAVLLCLHYNSYVFSKTYVEVESEVCKNVFFIVCLGNVDPGDLF